VKITREMLGDGDLGLCPACPPRFRGLYAVAKNAMLQIRADPAHGSLAPRTMRKLEELAAGVAQAEMLTEAHFAEHGPGTMAFEEARAMVEADEKK
jgi:hypothetical protein